ncbi:MAG: GNAT family N-acetyltransferase [Lachnospiraceae bacterium]|nr:GNAT family N-acetyltransferase [Lachnospiraceae bacterium]
MQHSGTKTIETERLILRQFRLEDAEDMYKNWASDDAVTRYLTWPTHGSVETSREVLRIWTEGYASPDYYQWCIEYKESGEAIGSISIVNINEKIDSVEVGYCISRKYWHQGITTEAFHALISYLFYEVRVNRIEARHDRKNPWSGKVMEKCGLKKEGVKRMGDRNNTGICDTIYYGIIKDEWQGNR